MIPVAGLSGSKRPANASALYAVLLLTTPQAQTDFFQRFIAVDGGSKCVLSWYQLKRHRPDLFALLLDHFGLL
jgi:hypothetical protein